jgi:hypothetical protein
VGGSINVVLISASASADRSRADTQHLRIVITNANAAAGIASSDPGAVPATRAAVPLKRIGPIPNLSSSPPAQR